MTVQIYRPDGDVDATVTPLAAAKTDLAGVRIAVLDNGKPNAVELMTRAAETLAARTGAVVSLVVKKGPGGRSANAAIPCAPDVFEQVRTDADVVITGAADCGSCTAYSVHDTVEFEKRGVPTVLLTTTRFRPIAMTLAAATGLPEMRALVVDHPIGGVDLATLHRRADAACDALVALFTGAGAPPTHPEPAALDLDDVRELVAADGADFEVVTLEGGELRLRLLIPDAHCAECVMPRTTLESIAASRLAGHGVHTVVIDDPRDQ